MVCGKRGLSEIRRIERTFGGLGLQGHPDGYLVRNILKVRALNREREQERISLN